MIPPETSSYLRNAQLIKSDTVVSHRGVLILGLHDHDPTFRKISLSEDIKHITREIGFRDPRMLQSMIICKQPEIGGKGTKSQVSC